MRRALPVVLAIALSGCHRDSAQGPTDPGPAPEPEPIPTTVPPPGHPCAQDAAGAPWLAFSSNRAGSYDLYVARADGRCAQRLTSDDADDLSPSYGRGGLVAYASDRNLRAGIWLHDIAASMDWAVPVGTLSSANAPAFSPDGSRIAFSGRYAGQKFHIWVTPTIGGDPIQLTSSAADDAGPAWSPDGVSSIFFVSRRDAYYDVYAVGTTGGPDVRVTNRSGILGKPAVSPDGTALYYARAGTSGRNEVVRFTLATRQVTVVTGQDDVEPAISPAGDRLAVRSQRTGPGNVWVVGAGDGADPVPITSDVASAGAPSFAPAP